MGDDDGIRFENLSRTKRVLIRKTEDGIDQFWHVLSNLLDRFYDFQKFLRGSKSLDLWFD